MDYVEAVTRRLGDRVKHWITHNEPWCSGFYSHQMGMHAPGLKDWPAALAASHHLLLSHGWAVPVLRQNSPRAEVGITLNFTAALPASPSAADLDACRHFDGYFNRWFLDPLFGRRYPADMVADYEAAGHWPKEGPAWLRAGDLAAIAMPTDFLGVNYYTRDILRSDKVAESENLARTLFKAEAPELTEMGWEVYPQGLYDLLNRIHFHYGPKKMYVTESGASYGEGPDAKGRIADRRRILYLRDHFAAASRAIANGVPLGGYFVWSLMDNFEWERGYKQRFGLAWTDYATQARLLKDSALWYRGVIAVNAVETADDGPP